MNEIQENGIKIYTGETDEDDEDNPEIKELKVSVCVCVWVGVFTNAHCGCSLIHSPSVPLQEIIPFAVVGSNTLLEVNGKRVRGRLYPWGVVEGAVMYEVVKTLDPRVSQLDESHFNNGVSLVTVENKDHCDFVKLRTMLIR